MEMWDAAVAILDSYKSMDICGINSQVNEQANSGLQRIKGQLAYMKHNNFVSPILTEAAGPLQEQLFAGSPAVLASLGPRAADKTFHKAWDPFNHTGSIAASPTIQHCKSPG